MEIKENNNAESELIILLKRIFKDVVIQTINEYEKEGQIKKKKYITRKEASEMLNVTYPTLWKLNKSGELINSKIGKKVIYDSDHIHDYLDRNKNVNG